LQVLLPARHPGQGGRSAPRLPVCRRSQDRRHRRGRLQRHVNHPRGEIAHTFRICNPKTRRNLQARVIHSRAIYKRTIHTRAIHMRTIHPRFTRAQILACTVLANARCTRARSFYTTW
jgi:hypothetical protein